MKGKKEVLIDATGVLFDISKKKLGLNLARELFWSPSGVSSQSDSFLSVRIFRQCGIVSSKVGRFRRF